MRRLQSEEHPHAKSNVWKWMLLFSPLLALALLFLWILLLLPAQYGDTYLAALQDKTALLHGSSEKKRIVTVGGSGAAFGQWSDLLEKEFPEYAVINDGLYAGLGTAPMMDLARQDIRPGDIVILSPEQNRQSLSGFFGARAMWQAADGAPGLLLRISPGRWRSLLGEALPFCAEKFSFWMHGNAPHIPGFYPGHECVCARMHGQGRERVLPLLPHEPESGR